MQDNTKEQADEILEMLDNLEDVNVSAFNLTEYIRGDPTADDAEATGAEIEMTCYISHETSDEQNQYRVK